MIDGRSVLAFIPARGGSKGLPGKNLCRLGGRPLLEWTVAAAKGAKAIDHIILSTEDESILECGRALGCDIPFRRPPALATDTSRTIHVLHHLLDNIDTRWDYVVQLQPTSPLRSSIDIDDALALCIDVAAPSCVSVCPSAKSPSLICTVDEDCRMKPVVSLPLNLSRRQDVGDFYEINGAIYIARTDWISGRESFLSDNTVAYVMPRDRSIDIDSELDLLIAESLLSRRSTQ